MSARSNQFILCPSLLCLWWSISASGSTISSTDTFGEYAGDAIRSASLLAVSDDAISGTWGLNGADGYNCLGGSCGSSIDGFYPGSSGDNWRASRRGDRRPSGTRSAIGECVRGLRADLYRSLESGESGGGDSYAHVQYLHGVADSLCFDATSVHRLLQFHLVSARTSLLESFAWIGRDKLYFTAGGRWLRMESERLWLESDKRTMGLYSGRRQWFGLDLLELVYRLPRPDSERSDGSSRPGRIIFDGNGRRDELALNRGPLGLSIDSPGGAAPAPGSSVSMMSSARCDRPEGQMRPGGGAA